MTDGTISYRMGKLEKQVDKMDCKIDNLLQNHLPHIEQDIMRMRTEVRILTGVNLTAIILGLFATKFL